MLSTQTNTNLYVNRPASAIQRAESMDRDYRISPPGRDIP